MRVETGVGFVAAHGASTELVGSRIEDEPHHVLKVVAASDELPTEQGPELRIRRRIAGAEVIHRLHQTGSQKVFPETIDHRSGEVGVVGCGQPIGQLGPRIGVGAELHRLAVEGACLDVALGAGLPGVGDSVAAFGEFTFLGSELAFAVPEFVLGGFELLRPFRSGRGSGSSAAIAQCQ